jgi:hypothetical protein
MPFPKETKIYGLTMADIRGQGVTDIITLHDSGRLIIQSIDGKFSWRSRERFGGTNNFYDTKKKKDPVYRYKDQMSVAWRVYIPGRVLIRDLDGDGLYEVIVNRNYGSFGFLDRAKAYEAGEVYSLVWEGDSLATNWKTREVIGYISDFQVRDVDNDGEEELVAAVVDPGAITDRKGTSNILFFKLF